MRIAVLIKQVPAVESLALGSDNRLVRSGPFEVNAYCRRAISAAVTMARAEGATTVVFTLGPPAAEDALREALAWGIDEAVLITDAVFAGSDTLATTRALAAALRHHGRFDLILAGRNSVDADTGQVGPGVAELLGLPFLAGAKSLRLHDATLTARLELDDGWADVEVQLPAIVSCAERLCEPAKVDPEGRAAVDAARIHRLGPGQLGDGPWGEAASPTRVGALRKVEVTRARRILTGTVGEQVAEAASVLRHSGALVCRPRPEGSGSSVADGWSRGERGVAVLVEPGRPGVARQLLGAAARLAHVVNGQVTAMVEETALSVPDTDAEHLGSYGADRLVVLQAPAGPVADTGLARLGRDLVEEDLARAVAGWARQVGPWAILAPGTLWGREVAGRVAARLGAGLTGDAVDLAVDTGRLVCWKPAFGGQLLAAITTTSPIQLATVRPGVLPAPGPRACRRLPRTTWPVDPESRLRLVDAGHDDDVNRLATADAVVGIGAGVDPADYARLTPLLEVLGAELAATRKVTDKGWQPRARQVGLTGRSLAPRLYVAIGLSGKFNHLVGVRSAGFVLALNRDPTAPVFAAADLGLIGDWRDVVPRLVERLSATS